MGEYLGVITWNVRGDRADQTAAQRCQDLQGVLTWLAGKPDCPVDLICLQETSGEQSGLMAAMVEARYACWTLQEGDGQGRSYVFALPLGSSLAFSEPPQPCLFSYQSLTGSPLRYPAMARFVRREGGKQVPVTAFTFHAPLGGALVEGVAKCSQFAEGEIRAGNAHYVLVAGDLNINDQYQTFDSALGRDVYLLRRLFRGFAGVSCGLDHVLCAPDRGLRNLEGCDFPTSSDHHLIYCRIKLK